MLKINSKALMHLKEQASMEIFHNLHAKLDFLPRYEEMCLKLFCINVCNCIHPFSDGLITRFP